MPDPTVAAGVQLVATGGAVVPLVAFGIPLGLHPAVLVAGFFGAVVAILLLNTVPATGDTWRELLRTSLRRMGVAFASSMTAGYLTPLVLVARDVPEGVLLATAFLVGAGAQRVLARYVRKRERGEDFGETVR